QNNMCGVRECPLIRVAGWALFGRVFTGH
ncbi:hypothetical protein X777_10963, partial [Ooceraea biroi]